MGALQYLKSDIPIYLSAPSYQLYKTLIRLGIEKPVHNLHPLPFETPVTVGAFTVEGFASDHDEPGVMALLVGDGERWYAHSGDVRLNGPHPERVAHWAQVFHDKKLAMFMIEGTTFSFDTETPVEDQAHPSVPLTEQGFQDHLLAVLKQAPALVAINPYIRNYARLAAIQTVAHQAGRQMVWEKPDAAVLTEMTDQAPDQVIGETIELATIRQAPAQYVLESAFAHLDWLATLPVSQYVHTNGEPLGDYDPRFQQLKDFLAAHQIPLRFLSCSGHATRPDLIKLAQMVAPRIIVLGTASTRNVRPRRLTPPPARKCCSRKRTFTTRLTSLTTRPENRQLFYENNFDRAASMPMKVASPQCCTQFFRGCHFSFRGEKSKVT